MVELLRTLCCVFSVLAVLSLSHVQSLSNEEIEKLKGEFLPILEECSKQGGITVEALKEAKQTGHADAGVHCVMSCVFKKTGLIKEDGTFDKEAALGNVKHLLSDADDIARTSELMSACESVNEQQVDADDEACTRAKLLLECFMQHKDLSIFPHS